MQSYRIHLFICLGKHCSRKGSERIYDAVKDRISREGLKHEVRLSSSGCLRVCKETDSDGEFSPAIVLYPEGTWYRNVSLDDMDDIFERHVKNGEVVERLLHYRLPI
ncbi:MAG: (2Fe-2S) ferredoxin domain-containing protein [Deltaproteobacteria bacterium]|nr:(2Fe-2S) ferredoxin domain-containing protein [Deltaproteobacteria bacterium]